MGGTAKGTQLNIWERVPSFGEIEEGGGKEEGDPLPLLLSLLLLLPSPNPAEPLPRIREFTLRCFFPLLAWILLSFCATERPPLHRLLHALCRPCSPCAWQHSPGTSGGRRRRRWHIEPRCFLRPRPPGSPLARWLGRIGGQSRSNCFVSLFSLSLSPHFRRKPLPHSAFLPPSSFTQGASASFLPQSALPSPSLLYLSIAFLLPRYSPGDCGGDPIRFA